MGSKQKKFFTKERTFSILMSIAGAVCLLYSDIDPLAKVGVCLWYVTTMLSIDLSVIDLKKDIGKE